MLPKRRRSPLAAGTPRAPSMIDSESVPCRFHKSLQLAQHDFTRFVAQSRPDDALRAIEGRLIDSALQSSLHQPPLLRRIASGFVRSVCDRCARKLQPAYLRFVNT